MKEKWNVIIAKFLVILLFISIGSTGSVSYAAAPNDENYDDDAGYSNAGTQFEIDENKYTLTGPGPDTLVTNVAPSGWGELGDGGSDNFISIMGIDTLKIEAADGSYFKLNGFEMGFCSVAGVTITPETGAAITRTRAGDESYYSIDVSANTDFQYIRYFTISGTDMIMNIDDLDFSPAVPPTHTVTYNGNGNTGGSAPTDGSSPYTEGDIVTVLGNSGMLVKTGYSFAGWNTAANGSGTDYAPTATFAMGNSNVTLYAKWAPLYTVTYNGNSNTGGSVPTDGNSYLSGDTVTALGNTGTLVRTGYTFAGWNTAANGSGTSRAPADTFAMGGSNVTLYAQWTPIDYTVTYNGNTNTGGAVPTDGNAHHISDTVTVLGNTGTLVKMGYSFAGWNTAANGSGDGYAPAATFAMGGSNVTLYAQWTESIYSVTYNGNSNTGGSAPTDETSYHNGDTAAALGNTGTLVRTGYTFAGWNTAANGSGTGYIGGDTFSMGGSNVTLYAQWTPIDYTVTYNGNTNTGGAVPTDGYAYHITDTVTVRGNTGTLVKTGYSFAGWNTAANGSGDGYAPAATFAMGGSNVTLYAQWTESTYSVTYNGNSNTGGSAPTDATSYHNGHTATVLGNTGTFVRTGYTFSGWNTADNGSGTSYTGGDTFAIASSNVILHAQWTAVDYTVTYDGNTNTGGAVPVDGNTYNITDTATVLGNTENLVRTGYTFVGWNILANGTGTDYAPAATFAISSSNVTLYAKWTENVYTVTYDGNSNTGGAVPTDATSYQTTDTATVLGNTGTLVRTGYTFSGWNTAANGSGTSYTGGDTFAIASSNVTLHAQWTTVDYTVTYDGNTNTGGAVPVDGNTYNITDTATVLGNTENLVRTGYTFVGWNILANGTGTDYAPATTFAIGSSNVTLYAKWIENVYTVTYDGNSNTGGAVPTDATSYQTTDTATALGNTGTLVRTGYTFSGWNTAANGSGTSYTGGDTFAIASSNVTLHAQWTAVDYTVTYDGNTNTGGAVPVDGNTYNITDTATVLGNTENLVRTGYTFVGWNTLENGTGTDYAPAATFAIGSSNVTLYAKWTENVYTVTYDGNSNTGGAVPTDGTSYHTTDTATVLGNTGSLVCTGYIFSGWNTLANGTGTDYALAATFAIGSSNVNLYAKWTADTTAPSLTAGAVTRTSDTVGTVKFTSNEVGSYYYAVVADDVAEPVIDTTGAGIACTKAETTITNPTGLTAGAKDIYIKVKDGDGNVSTAIKIDIAAYVASSGGSSGGGSSGSRSSSTSTTQPSQNTIVVVNGNEQNAGKETQKTEDGKSTVTVEVDSKAIESKIDEAIKTNTTGTNNVIQVPIADTKSEVAKVELTGDIVKKLEENTFDVSIKRDNVEYIIPAEEFTISKVAENLGLKEKDLADIKVEVKITKLDDKVVERYNEVAKANGAELVFSPVKFEIVAKTTKTDGAVQEQNINKFSNYVARVMEIPTGVDPNKITTGIVFNADGNYSHVPTEIYQKDGKWYAKLNSLTNSDYSVIWNPVTVKSVENHWAKDAVNNMASRLVIFNPEEFEPNKAITRADFAEYIVRALGIYREGSTHENNFKDVTSTGERTLAILIANEYGIVSGYSDGTFRGDNQITREEAMVMYQRAMKIMKLVGNDENRYQSYTDYSQVGEWATTYVKEVLSAHVFNGTTATTISPKACLTYAESAQAIKNLLVESNLISE